MDIKTLGKPLRSIDFGYATGRGRPAKKEKQPVKESTVSIVVKKHADRLQQILIESREALMDSMIAERGLT